MLRCVCLPPLTSASVPVDKLSPLKRTTRTSMSNTSPLEPCPPDGAAMSPFVLLEPLHDSDFSKQIGAEPEDATPRTSSNSKDSAPTTSDHDSIELEVSDQHLPPRPELQELAQAAEIVQEKRDSRISLSLSADDSSDASKQDTRQSIYLVDEDIQLHLRFYRRRLVMMALWYLLCIITAGISFIVDHYAANKFWIRWNTAATSLAGATKSNKDKLIHIKSKHGEVDILPLKRITFHTPMSLANVFPPSLREPYRSPEDAIAGAKNAEQLSSYFADSQLIHHIDVLEYRATTLLLHPLSGKFHLLAAWRDSSWASASSSAAIGLSDHVVDERQALFGPNQVVVQGKSVLAIMIEEVLHPFYIFQIYSVILWCNDDYVPYAIVILIVSVIGIASTTITTKAAVEKLKKMSRFSCDVKVLRSITTSKEAAEEDKLGSADSTDSEKDQSAFSSGKPANAKWATLDSEDLVPGDIIDLGAKYDDQTGHRLIETLPCDVVLLEGDCIVNESMLTGESVPVVKAPVSKADLSVVLASGKDLAKVDKNVLYSGTKIVRVRPGNDPSNATRGLVIRTGFSTAKGSLVRQMLFPRPIKHKFYRDAFLFIGNLFFLAFIGLIATVIYFKIIGVSSPEIAVRSLDVLTIAVPPALPATLSICVTFSIARLKRVLIFCLSPQRINVAGMVNMFVFDKTGTLTEEGLDVLGVRAVKDGKFTDLIQQEQQDDQQEQQDHRKEQQDPRQQQQEDAARSKLHLVEAMAAAHDLNLLDGEPIGEPLEVKMLQWTGRSLQDNGSLAPVHLAKEQEQAHKAGQVSRRPLTKDGLLARVPVVLAGGSSKASLATVRTFEFTASLRRMSVVVKRENELSAQVYCKGAPESLASLCIAESLPSDYDAVLDRCTRSGFRVLAVAGKTIKSLGWEGSQALPRAQAESQLQFLGLIIFENKLKTATTESISVIREDAQLPIKMCTGDSVLTAVSVAKDCGIMSSNASVYTPRIASKRPGSGSATVEWVSIDADDDFLDPYTLDPVSRDGAKLKDVELAVSGENLRTLLETCSAETMARVLVHCKVFGRFSPEQKQDLVERLQTLGYVVAFTGDGANDCGALKSADVGLSLSEAEASVAAPFTSKNKDISAITHLVREGRSTLSTQTSMFLFMAIYSLAEYFTVLLLYGKATSLDNAEYLMIDIFCVLPIAVGLANSRPAKKLYKIPPQSRLASAKPIVSMLGQAILGFLAQTTIYLTLHSKSWYQPPEFDPENLTLNDMDNTALFRVSIFTYIIAGITYSLGPPHKELLCFNWILAPALAILSVFAFYFLFLTSGPFFNLFGFVDMPKHFRWIIFGVVIAQFVVTLVFEFTAVAVVAKVMAKPFNAAAKRLGRKSKKPYKAVEKAIYSS